LCHFARERDHDLSIGVKESSEGVDYGRLFNSGMYLVRYVV
jgi:hypothetical protein